MVNNLFDFNDPNILLQRHTAASNRRVSGTVPETVRHGMIHVELPTPSIHHTVIAACPSPDKNLEAKGEFYMIAYVSIPGDWLRYVSDELVSKWDVTFCGPVGTIQKLPPVLSDMEDLLGARVYMGFDWMWLGEGVRMQPNQEGIKKKLAEFISALRSEIEPRML